MKKQSNQITKTVLKLYLKIVEYINQQHFSEYLTLFILAFQSFCLISDLVKQVWGDSQILNTITYFGFISFAKDVIKQQFNRNSIIILIIGYLMVLQLIIYFALIVLYIRIRFILWPEQQVILQIKDSIYIKVAKIFYFIFQYVWYPLLVSLSIYISNNTGTTLMVFLCVLLILLTFIVCCVIEYHLLEIDPNPAIQYQLVKKNLSGNIADIVLILIYLLTINLASIQISIIYGIITFLLRIALSFYMPFYEHKLNKYHQFLQGCCVLISSSLLICFRLNEPVIMLLVSLILCLIWGYIIFVLKKTNYERLPISQENQNQVTDLQKSIREKYFGKVYLKLIIMQNKSDSHRQRILLHVLKNKCIKIDDSVRGGQNRLNLDDLLKFQSLVVKAIRIQLQLVNHSVQILKFMQVKQPRCQIFLEQVQYIVNLIAEFESTITNILKINKLSVEAIELTLLLCSYIITDNNFTKFVQEYAEKHAETITQKRERKKLFNINAGAIYLNAFDDIGKITKVSKNIPEVIGYQTFEMIGVNVTQFIPFGLRNHHQQKMLQFLKDYNKKGVTTQTKQHFYAYTKQGFVQSIMASFYLNMHGQQLQICGLIKKGKMDYPVILADALGYLQGWTEQLKQLLPINLTLNQSNKHNIFLIIPALIKYASSNDKQKLQIRTLYFVPHKLQHQIALTGSAFQEDLVNQFQANLKAGNYLEVKMVHIIFDTFQFCDKKAVFKRIQIKKFLEIQNSRSLMQIIKSQNYQSTLPLNQEVSNSSELTDKNSKSRINYDFNFKSFEQAEASLNIFQIKFINQRISSELNDSIDYQGDQMLSKNSDPSINQVKSKITTNNMPSLEKIRLGYLFIPLAFIFLSVVIIEQVIVENFSNNVIGECENVIKRNYFYMILAKSVFNPNITYIKKFNGGYLVQAADWMKTQTYNYTTLNNLNISISKFYLFNVQIPSMLDRLVITNITSELYSNFYNLVRQFDSRLIVSLTQWSASVSNLNFYAMGGIGVIILGSLIYVIFLVIMFVKQKKLNKTVEAFFKFQRSDIIEKSFQIKDCEEQLYYKINQWTLNKQFSLKLNESKLKSSIATEDNAPINLDISQQRQNQISRRKTISLLILISIFLIGQILYIIIYTIQARNLLNLYNQIPQQLDNACKLIVLPNLQMANLFTPVPSDIILKYSAITPNILSSPQADIPNLFNLLETPPCSNCTFLYPILTTNFRSFYSSFSQQINQKTINHDTNISQLFYGVDVVVQAVKNNLNIRQIPKISQLVWIYIISLIIFMIEAYYGYRKMQEQTQRLEVFLKYFDDQTLLKNKHLNNIVKKAI